MSAVRPDIAGGTPFRFVSRRAGGGGRLIAWLRRQFPVFIFALVAATAVAHAGETVSRRTFPIAGKARTYYSYTPASIDAAAQPPLLILLHGSFSDGREILAEWTMMADREGLLLAAPNATTSVGWKLREDGPDFMRKVVVDIATWHPFNRRRTYLFGYSAGAVQALNLGMVESTYFSAIAVWAGAWRDRPSLGLVRIAERKIPVAIFIGDKDEFLPPGTVANTRVAFENAGHPLMPTILPGKGHSYHDVAARVNPQAWEFLRATELPGEPVYRSYN